MKDKPSTDELLDERSLQDIQEPDSPTNFEMDGISAEEMADDAKQQEEISSSDQQTTVSE